MIFVTTLFIKLVKDTSPSREPSSTLLLCTYHCQAPPTPGRARVGIIGDLQKSFDKFPTPGDNFMSQIPYILYRDSKTNENSRTNAPALGTKYADKSLQIPTHCPTWGRWGLTMIGALEPARKAWEKIMQLGTNTISATRSHVINQKDVSKPWSLLSKH